MKPPRVVFVVALVVFTAALGPGAFWLDSSELATAAFELGVAHPPGHPLWALLAKAATLVPLGDVAMRVGWSSAVFAALAAGQATRLGTELASRLGSPRPGWLGAAAGLAWAGTWAMAFSAVRAEVYALSSLLTMLAAVALLRFEARGERVELWRASFWAGLGLGNHPLLGLSLIGPGLVVGGLAIYAHRRQLRLRLAIGGALGLGALSVLLLPYLPLRALRHPLVDWGAPTDLGRIWWTVSARAFQSAVERGGTGELGDLLGALSVELRGIGVLLAVLGAWLLVRRRETQRPAWLLVGLCAVQLGARATVGFDWGNPDAWAYFSDGVAMALMLSLVPLAKLRGRLAQLACMSWVVLALASGLVERGRWWIARHHDLPRVLGSWLDATPPRGMLVTSYFQTVFGLWYLRGVEGRRPDVDLVHRHFLVSPGYRDELLRRNPALAPVLGERDVNWAQLPAGAVVEYDLDQPKTFLAATPVPAPQVELTDEEQTTRYLGWQAFLAAHQACREHRKAEVATWVAEARRRLGDGPELQELLANCR